MDSFRPTAALDSRMALMVRTFEQRSKMFLAVIVAVTMLPRNSIGFKPKLAIVAYKGVASATLSYVAKSFFAVCIIVLIASPYLPGASGSRTQPDPFKLQGR